MILAVIGVDFRFMVCLKVLVVPLLMVGRGILLSFRDTYRFALEERVKLRLRLRGSVGFKIGWPNEVMRVFAAVVFWYFCDQLHFTY